MDDDFERYLDIDTLRLIRRKARYLAGRYGFQLYEAEDIQQSLILDCLERLRRFDPQRGTRANFARSIVSHGVATLIEARRCRRGGYDVGHLSLSAPIDNNNLNRSTLADVISENDYHNRMGRSSKPVEQILHLKLDVNRAIAALPDSLRRICRLLMVLDHVAQVGAAVGISRATLHRRIRIIRAAFARFPLSDYKQGVSAFPGTGGVDRGLQPR